jgi:hypothetical protein
MISNTPYSGDQFGYYTVGENFKTYSKLLAIEETKRTGIHLKWHFNQPQYEMYNWTIEPTESLDELYRQRAQQIRDNYDYIVVWYSGGADSWCVLDTFLKNNIKIDEIGQIHSYEGDNNKNSVFNEEIFYTAIPATQAIINDHPEINHRVVDISKIISDLYLRPDVKYDYIYNIKGIMSANSLARSYLREYIDDYKKLIDSGKRVCFIWGSEKPRLKLINNKYHTCFIDVFSETNLRLQSQVSRGYFDEWFFWGADCAPIVAKQSHILMRVLSTENNNSSWFVNSGGAHIPVTRSGKYLRNDIYHTLIYPGWDPATLVAPKPRNLLLSERDHWFWNQGVGTSKAVQNAQGGIKELLKIVGNYWINDTNDLTRGIKGCLNTYQVEKNDI